MPGARFVCVFLIFVAHLLVPGVSRAQTTEADVYVAQAVIDFDEKRYEAALENLKSALELEPDHIEALYYMGVVQMAMRQPNAAVPFLVRARQKSATDTSVAFQLGLAYFAQQQYDQAEPLLEEVFKKQPTLDGLGYYVGFMRYRKKDYRGALEAFRGGRSTDQDLQQLTRFYTGLALAVLGLPTQAAAAVEEALRTAPASALTGPAERLRDTIVAARSKERCPTSGERKFSCLSAELKLGFFYDDNVAVVPNPISPNIEPLVEQLRLSRHESIGEIVGLRLDYSWLKQLLKREDWDGTIGYSFFLTQNNDLNKFNVSNHLVNAGLTHRVAMPAVKTGWFELPEMPGQVGAQYAWDILFLREKEFLKRSTTTLFGALVEPIGISQLFGRYQDKQFARAPGTERREIRDAQNIMIGLLHLFPFKEGAHHVKIGAQWDRDDTIGKNFTYHGYRLVGGVQFTLEDYAVWKLKFPLKGIRLKYDIDAHLRTYEHPMALSSGLYLQPVPEAGRSLECPNGPGGICLEAKRRRDEEVTHTVRSEIPLLSTCLRGAGFPALIKLDKDSPECVSWTLAAEYQRTTSSSNIPLFDYNRNVFSVFLTLTY